MPLTKFNPKDFEKNVKETFSDETFRRANSLIEPKKTKWQELFFTYYPNKVLYEELLTQINEKKYDTDNITEIMSNRTNYFDSTTKQENVLLQMLNGPSDTTPTPIEEAIEKAKTLSRQGSVIIRPNPSSVVTPPTKPRK